MDAPARSGRSHDLLFPDPPRKFAGQRALKITLRAVHVLCVSLLVGAHAFGADADAQSSAMIATVASGLVLLAMDLTESFAILFQVRGAIVLAKVGLLAILPAFGERGTLLLAGLVLVSVVVSHAPARFRYHMLIGRGIVQGPESKG